MRITTVLNQKGGTGKTTTAAAMAAGLAQRGRNALLIDADAQGNASYCTGADPQKTGLYELLKHTATLPEAIQHTEQGFDVITSNLDLAAADLEFTAQGREYLLREALEPVKEYSHIIIDSPPALGIMSINALTASGDVVIPANADMFSLQGLNQLLDNIARVRKYSNHELTVSGLLITRKGGNTVATRAMIEQIQTRAEAAGLHIYGATIREATAVREAQILRVSIFDHAPRAKVTEDYNQFIDEYLMQERG